MLEYRTKGRFFYLNVILLIILIWKSNPFIIILILLIYYPGYYEFGKTLYKYKKKYPELWRTEDEDNSEKYVKIFAEEDEEEDPSVLIPGFKYYEKEIEEGYEVWNLFNANYVLDEKWYDPFNKRRLSLKKDKKKEVRKKKWVKYKR